MASYFDRPSRSESESPFHAMESIHNSENVLQDCQEVMSGLNSLHEVMDKQVKVGEDFRSEVREQMKEICGRMKNIEEQNASNATRVPETSSKKKETPTELSITTRNLIARSGEDLLFKVPDGWNTEHNLEVRDKLFKELSLKFGDRYTNAENRGTYFNYYYCTKAKHKSTSIVIHNKVRELDLSECDITDDGLRILALCKQLRKIDLNAAKEDRTTITSVGVQYLAMSCPILHTVYLRRCRNITDDAIITISQHCRQLMQLNIGGCQQLTDTSLMALGQNCRMLKCVNFNQTRVIHSKVRELDLSECDITDDGLRILALCKQLRKIDLNAAKEDRTTITSVGKNYW
uniref:Uncharacterized protein LOC100370660 n=1 Tax=Saccoglossus kowalevskii TaxID=10224 RepID=A0ABM0MBS6_SACKO|nr:PREDICTED: uncharacterized protein LOC100370660 [Saccoglossus kowalevskii]